MTALVGISVHHFHSSGRSRVSVFGVIFLVISYHWTSQVLKNILHVTVSGVVGTWYVHIFKI
jgi:Plasma-membrane choline transporter